MPISIKKEELAELLKDFYILTKMRIVIFDSDYVKIMSYPVNESDFCTMIKENDSARQECEKSDIKAFNTCRNTKNIFIYKCHAGLIEVASPIKINDLVLGYVMFGQIVDKSVKSTEKINVLNKCVKYNLEQDILSSNFDKLIFKSEEQIRAASKILESCACYLWISNLIKVNEESFFLKLDNYITENLDREITPQIICEQFNISRNKLYEISDKSFGMGISAYVRKRRIEQAKKLLENGTFSISEVCYKVGVPDYNYFSKMFKKETGLSPRHYLKGLEKI